jgi:outer membrane protein OmpA-like peptidoglycan-associated protein
MLQQSPDLKLSIEGHTDSDGTAEGNQKLSEERALAVKDALISKGCNANRLISRGYGMSSPVADNNSEEGKAKNRRVELLKTN